CVFPVFRCVLPEGGASPGSMFVSQDVDDLLDQLCRSHMITVFGGAYQVIAHLLFFTLICRILSTVRL
ncbi:uncharacterized, partial [Tachysurus ichikawai]